MCVVFTFLASTMERRCLNSPGFDELTSARVLGRLLYTVVDASFKPSSRTLETSENTVLLVTSSEAGASPARGPAAGRGARETAVSGSGARPVHRVRGGRWRRGAQC